MPGEASGRHWAKHQDVLISDMLSTVLRLVSPNHLPVARQPEHPVASAVAVEVDEGLRIGDSLFAQVLDEKPLPVVTWQVQAD